jgi:Raf kinase inhibitor-like YbhB/YbcL family protein
MLRLDRSTALALGGLLAVALLVAGCGSTAEAPTDETAGEESPTGEPAEDEGSVAEGDGPFTFTAEGFGDGDAVPVRFTCEGEDVSPQLTWSGAPAGTRAFAIIVDDPDAPSDQPFVHFVLYDLPGGETGLEGAIPVASQPQAGGYQGKNDFGRTGWGGPCPPRGDGPHSYRFSLYALDAELGLNPGSSKDIVLQAADGHILELVQLVATYER